VQPITWKANLRTLSEYLCTIREVILHQKIFLKKPPSLADVQSIRLLVDEATALSFAHDDWWLLLQDDEETQYVAPWFTSTPMLENAHYRHYDGRRCRDDAVVQSHLGILEAALGHFRNTASMQPQLKVHPIPWLCADCKPKYKACFPFLPVDLPKRMYSTNQGRNQSETTVSPPATPNHIIGNGSHRTRHRRRGSHGSAHRRDIMHL
jgi:hypothetical protein